MIDLFKFRNLSLIFVELDDQSFVFTHETLFNLIVVIGLVAI